MPLVAYSDSEGSDAEPDPSPPPAQKEKKPDTAGFKVDRSNPRRIRVALPEIKPENTADEDAGDGPRKKAKLGGAGGAFSGFNAFLPAPKRQNEKKAPVASSRKVFSLKTGATPGFSRDADAELREEQAFNAAGQDFDNAEDDTIPKAGSLADPEAGSDSVPAQKPAGEVKLQGNAMMFKPLSVGRQKKKKPVSATASVSAVSSAAPKANTQASAPEAETKASVASAPPAPPKRKLNLFSLSSENTEDTDSRAAASTSTSTYEPLVYTNGTEADTTPSGLDSYENMPATNAYPTTSSVSSSLDNIATDLNLSKSERRQLFGRNAPSANSQILTFNTDQEYATNQAMAATELAGTQHNPVRAVAHGGKTSLQQLVNSASNQKEALEESFATGRRNKKEAGSKYGW